MQRSFIQTGSRPRNWLVILDYVFYLVLIVGVAAFGYYLYSYGDVITLYLPFLLQAAALTIGLSVVSMVLAVIFGFIGATGRLSRFAPVRWLATAYVEVVRGTPILVQLLLWYYGVGQALSLLGFDPYNTAFQVMTVFQNNSLVPDAFSAYFYGVIGLSFNYGAYLTEVFRSGIESNEAERSQRAEERAPGRDRCCSTGPR